MPRLKRLTPRPLIITAYLIVQGLVLFFVPLVLFDPHPRNILNDARDPYYFTYALTGVLGISAAQLTLLLPAIQPGLKQRQGHSRLILRHITTGLALGWCTAVASTFIIALIAGQFGASTWALARNVYWISLGIATPLCTIASYVFARGRTPMLPSVICAAAASVAMAVSLVLAMLSLGQLLMGEYLSSAVWSISLVLTIVVGWVIATPLLAMVMVRGRRVERLSRTANWLVAGSALEALLILPIDVMIRRKTDCYCSEGTYFAWIVLSGAALFAFGPMILLAPMARKHRRLRARQCIACGYDLRSTPRVMHCPECGTPTRRRIIARQAD